MTTLPPIPGPWPRLARAGLLTSLVDCLFSSILVVFFYHSTFARLWQGVASTLLGPGAIGGGTRPMLIGLAMHVGVAFGWSTVFLALYARLAWLRHLVGQPSGFVKVAAVYGPCIWLVMSLVVIPTLYYTAYRNRLGRLTAATVEPT